MNRPLLITSTLALVAVAGLSASTAAPAAPRATAAVPSATAADAFASIKSLEGTWMLLDEHGQTTDQVASIYSVTAAGHAVMETMFPGQEHEMLNVYFLDGDALRMTHYCAIGNRPTMTRSNDDPHALAFVCAADDCCSPEDHMHSATMTLVDDANLSIAWGMNPEAHEEHAVTFNLQRAPAAPGAHAR